MRAPPRLTVSEWADAYRYLSPESSPEPGKWHTSRAEYQRGIMDATSAPEVTEVVVMKSAQVGWTEILGNIVGFHIHQDPSPLLVVQPTIEMGEAWSNDRLTPMLRDTPVLRGAVGEAKSRKAGSTMRRKSFPGGQLTIAGANSAASLASRPIRILLCDEVDRYPASAGEEGDPVTLARKRTNNFWNRRTLLGSTPLIAGSSRIEKAYEGSDKRRYWVPCPHCDEMQVLRWEQVKWVDDDASTAAYHCADCGAAWSNVQRWAAVRVGEWRAERPFRGVAGFHISELYSPWRKIEETVSDFLEAHRGGLEQIKAWKNTALGEVWQEKGDAPEWERLVERREPLPMGIVPSWAVVLTAGVDNQTVPERLEMTVWAWGPGYESAPIHAETMFGSPADNAPWDRVAALMTTDWPREGGGTMRIAKLAADTNGNFTAAVYGQLRRLRDPRIAPIRGQGGWNRASPVTGPTFVDVTAGGRKVKRGLRLWVVSVDTYKADLYSRLWLNLHEDGSHPAGWVHLPQWFDVEQVKQLVAEELVTIKDRRGFARREWNKLRANEQLDMAVYARAALNVLGSDRYGERFWDMMRKGLDHPSAPGIAQAKEPPVEAPAAAEIIATPIVAQKPAAGSPAAGPRRKSRWAR